MVTEVQGISLFLESSTSVAPPPLAPEEVHVWLFKKEAVAVQLAVFEASLAEDERQRARRLCRAYDREMSITARGLLRRLLSSYVGIPPRELRFVYSPNGKPELREHRSSAVHFNVAHSGNVILIACGRERRVGVDVERVEFDCSIEPVAERFFSKAECGTLRSLPLAERVQAFYRCWTRKEAYLKATGAGLAKPLDTVDVSARGDRICNFVQDASIKDGVACWLLQSLTLGPDYAAALATECRDGQWNNCQLAPSRAGSQVWS